MGDKGSTVRDTEIASPPRGTMNTSEVVVVYSCRRDETASVHEGRLQENCEFIQVGFEIYNEQNEGQMI